MRIDALKVTCSHKAGTCRNPQGEVVIVPTHQSRKEMEKSLFKSMEVTETAMPVCGQLLT